MTQSTSVADGRGSVAVSRTGRSSGALIMLCVVTFLAFCNYAAMLSVVPLWAARGGATSGAVGATTGTMMAATVATQLAMPWLFRLLSLRAMAIVGSVLLGAPTPLYLLSSEIVPVLAFTVVRGMGFGLAVIAGATLVTKIAAEGRLASSASLYGAAAALPNLAALAGGVWLAQTWGFAPVFWVAGVVSVVAGVLAIGLPGLSGTFTRVSRTDVRAIAAPVWLFLIAAGSFGAVMTFLPVAVGAEDGAMALLAASISLVIGRLTAGWIADRGGSGRILLVAVLSCAAGLAVLAVSLGGGVVLLLGATLLGAGFGAAQNDSFVTVVCRMGPGHAGTASTIWNIAYDGGLGLGAVTLGWVIAGTGYAWAFAILAGGMVVVTIALRFVPRGRRSAAPLR